MQVTANVDLSGFLRSIETYQVAFSKSWRDSIRGAGRLLAVSLAKQTQPWGDSSEDKKKGEIAVMRDVGRVYSTSSGMYERLQESGLRIARAYWALMNSGRQSEAERILQSAGIQAKHVKTIDPAIHQSRRNNRGRVPGGKRKYPSAIVFDARKITTYANKVARRVGTAKSGWAQCAEDLGSARGIPQWAKKNRSSGTGGVIDNSSAPNNPHIIIENKVRYIGSVCRPDAIRKAVDDAEQKLINSLKINHENAKKHAGLH